MSLRVTVLKNEVTKRLIRWYVLYFPFAISLRFFRLCLERVSRKSPQPLLVNYNDNYERGLPTFWF